MVLPLVLGVLAAPPLTPTARAVPGDVSFVGSAATKGNRANHKVNVPGRVHAGDVLLLHLVLNKRTAIRTVPGWQVLRTRNGKGVRARVWTRVATRADAGSRVRVRTGARAKSVLTVGAYRSSAPDPRVRAVASGGSNKWRKKHHSPRARVAREDSWAVSIWSGRSKKAVGWRLPGAVDRRRIASAPGKGRVSAAWADSGGTIATGTTPRRTARTTRAARSALFTVVIGPGQRNTAPTAAFTPRCELLTCTFDAAASSDPEDDDLTYAWDFGDGDTSTDARPEHTYAKGGPRTVRLTVSDGEHTHTATHDTDPWDPDASGEIAFVAARASGDNRTAHSVRIPDAVRAGDRLVLFLVANSTETGIGDELPGWELLQSRDGNGILGRAWTRSAIPSDGGRTVTVPGTDYAKSTMSIAAYRSTGESEVSASAVDGVDNGAGTEHTVPDTEVEQSGSWLVHLWSEKSSTEDTVWTVPEGVTERAQHAATGPGKVSAVLGDSDAGQPAGPAPGGTATTSTVASQSMLFSVAVRPGKDATRTNRAPVAAFATGCAGLTCEFDTTDTFDVDGDDLTYAWDFGDGNTSTAPHPEHTYAAPGEHTVRLTVSDGDLEDSAEGSATSAAPNTPPGHEQLVPTSPRTDQPEITDGEIWDIEVVGNWVYVAGSFTEIQQPGNGPVIEQPELVRYRWDTGEVDTDFRPTFTNGHVNAVEATPDGSKLFIGGDFGTVDGLSRKAIARIDPETGAPLEHWQANGNGKVFELAVTNTTVYAGGRFTTLDNVPRGGLAALDAETGEVRSDFVNDITGGIGTNGGLAVQRLMLTHDEGRLLVVHTGRQINGKDRYGIGIINTRTNKLTPWRTKLWEDNLQFVGGIQRIYGGDVSPDDSRIVVTSGSGGDRPPINDTVVVFDLDDDPDAQPVWIARHFDSVYSVEWTEAGLYIGGHFQWAESATAPVPWPGLDDQGYGTGQGLSGYGLGDSVVKRFHLAALDPEEGYGLEWYVSSNSYEGDKHIEATPQGLFIGGDGNTKGGYNVGRIGFFDFDDLPPQNGTRTEITDPIEGRIKAAEEEFEITGTASAASGIERVEVQVTQGSRYLNEEMSFQAGPHTFEATLDPGTGERTWRLPVTIAGNRELEVRATAVADGGPRDNSPATKRFETFGLSDLPPDARITEPRGTVNALTFTVEGEASDDVGVNAVSFTLRDSQNRYLQADGTVSGAYHTFRVEPHVVGAPQTTWSHEITVPYEDEWWAQVRATDTAGQTSLDTSDRRWNVTENGQPPTVSITAPGVMVPPTAAQPVTVEPGSPLTFTGTATDDEGLSRVAISLRNRTTGEQIGTDGQWSTATNWYGFELTDPNFDQPNLNWSWTTPTALTPGVYDFAVSASDHTGLSTSFSDRAQIQVIAQVPGDEPPNGLLDVTGTITGGQELVLELSGSATDDQGVQQVRVELEERDTRRYLRPDGTLSAAYATLEATLASPGATSTTWSLPVDLPTEGDWRVTAYAVDTAGQQDPSTSGASARYVIYPGDRAPTLTENLLNPLEDSEFVDGKVFVSGRAEDDRSMAEVEVAVVNEAGEFMGSTGSFGSRESWRGAFLTSPGTPGSNFSYTTPVIPPGAYVVRVRAIDHHGFVSEVHERNVTVTHPPNDPPVASFTVDCTENVCAVDARGSTDENTPTLAYDWDFGDGRGDDGPVRSHTYTGPGEFTIVLTARDEWGATATAEQVVTITEPPGNRAPTAVIHPPSCAALSCNFSSVGSADPDTGDAISRSWDWGDGTPGSTSSSPSHTFPEAGFYTVSLTVTDGWGTATTVTREVTVTAE
ncbi:PKD domain-containing protein [Nocardioides panacisoli]|uniref:PKD domain-containing protein n=1 Tax=Nocardioides panacisoli TaxID=627624 RepID=UPI001C637248|nr:PKD domain-containing protein [Nocardioides panacisoli]QYJ04851.1 PKD domain-containing protein [Nocardioides panacisoli]